MFLLHFDAFCDLFGNRDKLRPDGPFGSYADFTYLLLNTSAALEHLPLLHNAPINVFPQRGEGGPGVIGVNVLPVSGASEQLLTQGSPQGRDYSHFWLGKTGKE